VVRPHSHLADVEQKRLLTPGPRLSEEALHHQEQIGEKEAEKVNKAACRSHAGSVKGFSKSARDCSSRGNCAKKIGGTIK